jgi:hypothetical protein
MIELIGRLYADKRLRRWGYALPVMFAPVVSFNVFPNRPMGLQCASMLAIMFAYQFVHWQNCRHADRRKDGMR